MSDSGEPAQRRVRLEPDIPLDFSHLPEVQEMIKENNRNLRPKRRMKTLDFVDAAFARLGCGAAEAAARLLPAFLQECVEKHGVLPRSAALARVLYLWLERGMGDEGQRLLKQVLRAAPSLRDVVVDEKVATVSLRLLSRSSSVDLDLMENILAMLPEGAYKRRVFVPLLEHARRTGNTALAFKTLRLGRAKNIEFWDSDYNELLSCLQSAASDSETSGLVDELLECMVDHHPVVGKSNGEALRQLVGGDMTHVDETTGKCGRCGTNLHTFDFTPSDRATLLSEIETKLIMPRVEGVSHYEPGKQVTPEEKERRRLEFETFKAKLGNYDYDAVIDGANVGYYGLSSWYREAKESLLRSRGVDPTNVPEYQLCEVPFPVDVSPKFSLIDEMITQTRHLGKKPLVMLHNRHLENPSEEFSRWIRKWDTDLSLMKCPGFLNDDYCWLYAAIYKPSCFLISNDKMRDHHFMLLSRRSFLRWRQRHRVTYRAFFKHATGLATLVVTPPHPFAVWVQRGKLSRAHWHVPVISTVDVIDQATNRISEKEAEIGKDGDDLCDAWLCTAGDEFLNRNE